MCLVLFGFVSFRSRVVQRFFCPFVSYPVPTSGGPGGREKDEGVEEQRVLLINFGPDPAISKSRMIDQLLTQETNNKTLLCEVVWCSSVGGGMDMTTCNTATFLLLFFCFSSICSCSCSCSCSSSFGLVLLLVLQQGREVYKGFLDYSRRMADDGWWCVWWMMDGGWRIWCDVMWCLVSASASLISLNNFFPFFFLSSSFFSLIIFFSSSFPASTLFVLFVRDAVSRS